MSRSLHAGVLVLPGGKPRSTAESRPWQLANQRIALLARNLQGRLGPDVAVSSVRYRLRGWNAPTMDALRDAQTALATLRRRIGDAPLAVVGHSMGGRVAAHLSADGGIGAMVALAPWWPQNDADLIPVGCRLLVLHGTADTWTDPAASQAQTERARARGVDAQWVPMTGAGHWLVRDWHRWHRLTADFVATHLEERLPEP